MKKFIMNVCAVSILATSMTSFAATDRQSEVRNILAKYTSSVERGESNVKAISEATLAIQAKGITAEEVMEFAAAGMSASEAQAFRSEVGSRLGSANHENIGDLVLETSQNLGQGANFRSGCELPWIGMWVGGIAAIVYLSKSGEAGRVKRSKERDINSMNLQKSDLQADIAILIGEGVKPESFLIASIQKDIDYLNVSIGQAQVEMEKQKKDASTFLVIGGAAAAVSAISFVAKPNCVML